MDNQQPKAPSMLGFYKLDPKAGEHDSSVHISDLVTALEATTQVLDDVIGNATELNKLQGLAIAARIFAGMIADRHSGENVVVKRVPGSRRPPGKRKQKPRASVVALVRPPIVGVAQESVQEAGHGN